MFWNGKRRSDLLPTRRPLLVLLLLQASSFAAAFHANSPLVSCLSKQRRTLASHSKHVLRHSSSSRITSDDSDRTPPSSSFDWKTEWYPVIPVQDLNRETPNKITLLGMDFCVWFHEPSQQWHCFRDECPHRLVPLSEGRVETSSSGDSRLQCAYHGWEFNEKGACVRIPQLSDPAAITSPSRACVTSFPLEVKQGLVWIFPTSDDTLAATKALPLIPELDDPHNVDATNFFFRDLPYSWEVLVENLCDPSHVNFAHHSFMGGANRNQQSLQMDMKVLDENSHGFVATKDPPPTGNNQYNVKFQAPCLLFYTIVNAKDDDTKKKKGSFLGLGQYCIPISPHRSRIIARFPFHLPFKPAMFMIRHTPRWMTHFSQNIVMDSDVVFLTSQNHVLEEQRRTNKSGSAIPNYYMPAQCDAMVVAFQKWLGRFGRGGPEWIGVSSAQDHSNGESLSWIRPLHVPAREGRDALLDRYRQHTDVCSSCRRAHKSLYVLREVLTFAGIILLAGSVAAGIQTTQTLQGSKVVRLAAITGASMLLVPRVLIRPLIARMECVPWPRKKWLK